MSVNPELHSSQPLSPEELHLADRVLRRIHEQFRAFLNGLPPTARNASALARFLSVDRTTCQRLVFIANRPYDGMEMIERLPGVRGLGQLLEAARRIEPPIGTEVLEALGTSVRRLEEALAALGGSQAVLMRRIAATPPGAGRGEDLPRELRRQLFDAAAALTGRCSDTWVAVYVYQPLRGEAMLDVARVHGLIGHQAKADAVPLTFHNFGAESGEGGRPFSTLGDDPAGVLHDFSTRPPAVVNAKQPGEFLVQAIDTDVTESGRAIDLMLGTVNATPHPQSTPPGVEEVWAMINFPARRMVFDVYLHQELARACIPALDVHLWRPDFARRAGDRWQTRFSDGPSLEVLGCGIARAGTTAYPRHAELTRYLFEKRALEPGAFVGFRCAVDYPIWRTAYCMSFDFNTDDGE